MGRAVFSPIFEKAESAFLYSKEAFLVTLFSSPFEPASCSRLKLLRRALLLVFHSSFSFSPIFFFPYPSRTSCTPQGFVPPPPPLPSLGISFFSLPPCHLSLLLGRESPLFIERFGFFPVSRLVSTVTWMRFPLLVVLPFLWHFSGVSLSLKLGSGDQPCPAFCPTKSFSPCRIPGWRLFHPRFQSFSFFCFLHSFFPFFSNLSLSAESIRLLFFELVGPLSRTPLTHSFPWFFPCPS